MTLAQMRTEVRRLLFELTADFFTNAEIDAWLNEAARLICKIAKPMDTVYSFNPTEISSSGVYNHEYAMPEGTDEIFEVFIENGDNVLTPLPLKQFKVLHGNAANVSGIPQWCYTRSYTFNTLRRTTTGVDTSAITGVSENAQEPRIVLGLYPKPTSTTPTFFVHYYSRHYTMSSDSHITIVPTEYRRGLIHYAAHCGFEKEAAAMDADRHLSKFNDYAKQFKEDMISKGQDLTFPMLIDDDEDVTFGVGWLT